MEINEEARRARGLQSSRAEFRQIRARLAEFTNEALRERGIAARVDHRSLAEQGIERRAGTYVGPAVTAILRRGGKSYVAERVQAEQAAERAAALEYERLNGHRRGVNSLEQQRRRALDSWQAYRRQRTDAVQEERERAERAREAERTAGHDYER
jgi:hypothetical protein